MSPRKIAIFLCLSLSTSPILALSVTVDWDRTIGFSGFRTYAWAKGTDAPSLVQERIVAAIDAELLAKGFHRVEDEADMYVVTHAAVNKEEQVNVADFGYTAAFSRGAGFGTTTVDVSRLRVGVLLVDIYDAGSKKLIWRGQASATVTHDKEKRDRGLPRPQG